MSQMESYMMNYLGRLHAGLAKLDAVAFQKIAAAIEEARRNGRWIYIIGNGGSAATAMHLANDFNKLSSKDKNPPFKAISLSDNISLLSAWANDSSYEEAFSKPLENFIGAGDVLICISASGNSPNIIRAIELAHSRRATTVGFLGFKGGKAMTKVDHYLLYEEEHYGRAEDAQTVIGHILANYLVEVE
jgi:D-sedoheptulose 7-phosphate isomerase